MKSVPGSRVQLLRFAIAVAEENAAAGEVVTAPTCGSCGIVPAVLRYLQLRDNIPDVQILNALAVAGLFGSVVRANASVSGADVGCQGEVGVACSLAAAAACYLLGGSPLQCDIAAEQGLESFLGLTCCPVLGLVQVPCIDRNVAAAGRALDAGELALLRTEASVISFDEVCFTMLVTGIGRYLSC